MGDDDRVPLLLAAALAGCGEEPTLSAAGGASATASPTATASGEPTETAAATPGATPVHGSSVAAASAPAAEPSAPPVAGSGGPDLDGDGRSDSVSLRGVPGMGWSFDVRLADGRETSAPLPDDTAVQTLHGHVAGPLGGARDDALSAEEVSLDPSTCDA